MKIYTRKGDDGKTATLSGPRLSKSAARIRALGGFDELNAHLGLVLVEPSLPEEIRSTLARIQAVLFEAGFELATSDPAPSAELLRAETVWLEQRIDEMDAQLPPLTRFILPGGSAAGARIHLARAVARRAETLLVAALTTEGNPNPEDHNPEDHSPVLSWFNRLSDALFTLARRANQLAGVQEVQWESRARPRGRP